MQLKQGNMNTLVKKVTFYKDGFSSDEEDLEDNKGGHRITSSQNYLLVHCQENACILDLATWQPIKIFKVNTASEKEKKLDDDGLNDNTVDKTIPLLTEHMVP